MVLKFIWRYIKPNTTTINLHQRRKKKRLSYFDPIHPTHTPNTNNTKLFILFWFRSLFTLQMVFAPHRSSHLYHRWQSIYLSWPQTLLANHHQSDERHSPPRYTLFDLRSNFINSCVLYFLFIEIVSYDVIHYRQIQWVLGTSGIWEGNKMKYMRFIGRQLK